MSILLQRIAELEREVQKLRRRNRELRRGREVWKQRALAYGRGHDSAARARRTAA